MVPLLAPNPFGKGRVACTHFTVGEGESRGHITVISAKLVQLSVARTFHWVDWHLPECFVTVTLRAALGVQSSCVHQHIRSEEA